MKSSAFYAVIGIGVLLVAGIIWWGVSHGHSAKAVPQRTETRVTSIAQVATSSVGTLSIYTNGTYGFSVLYPSDFPIQTVTGGQPIVKIGTAGRGVGISAGQSSSCDKPRGGEMEASVESLGTGWVVFTKSSLSMDLSYRLVKNSLCYEIHAVSTSTQDAAVTAIVHSFAFAGS